MSQTSNHHPTSFSHEEIVRFKGTTNTFFVIVNKGMPQKFRSDSTIPVSDVVQSFHIFKGEKVQNGPPLNPSKGELL